MAEIGWTKTAEAPKPHRAISGERLKYLIGGGALLAAVVVLMVSGTLSGMRYFITVDDLLADESLVGQSVRITGAVIGESINYNPETLDLSFTVANVPAENDDLGMALHLAVNNADAQRLEIVMENEVKPDLLVNEAQAILTGTLGADGKFYADSLLLKCPSRFSEMVPEAGESAAEPVIEGEV
ncbi:MAG: cytochrome c maturation protein CcmE [Anaerolineae bacterium]|nr:cytochrome c maturation protein CcmE [Chloroflexota bacterium]MBV6435297.1 Cytochrome c-type biogenesis protein CcmE [Anaerolineae bacterium]MDL1916357.1 cytochrome c maturation protein CcmE [Anaerolineae bacterium CFX4]OQY79678.1 MAG: hypothetical protein B6D42_14565 [Anaerolineae bacterium UTCFX5]MBW7879336.1 cytochrome c maturation protein CcmE [Anaerolineae bacterium]